MSQSIKGKNALITGAARRIGRETALALAEAGANIIAHYRSSEDQAADLVQELASLGVEAWTVRADFTKLDETESLIERGIREAGSLDILINSASTFAAETLDDVTFEILMRNMQVNAWTPFVLGRAFKRYVGRGSIVNLLDTRIAGYDWAHVGYIMSKHVLAVFTKMTAAAYAPDIAVNAVAPGLILPPPGKDESYIDALAATVPLKRHGGPRDVADAVLYLVQSDFVTGEVIYVDGGRHLEEYVRGTG